MSKISESYSVPGAAEAAGLAKNTLEKAIKRGEIEVELTLCGRTKLIPRRVLERWLAGAEERRKRAGRPRKK